jgi:hypothetical protein
MTIVGAIRDEPMKFGDCSWIGYRESRRSAIRRSGVSLWRAGLDGEFGARFGSVDDANMFGADDYKVIAAVAAQDCRLSSGVDWQNFHYSKPPTNSYAANAKLSRRPSDNPYHRQHGDQS